MSSSSQTISKKKEKRAVYVYRFFGCLKQEDVTFDDVFNELSLLFVQVTEENVYDFNRMECLTNQFAKGIAKDFLIPLQTFKVYVYFYL
jgi:hypothetical protein